MIFKIHRDHPEPRVITFGKVEAPQPETLQQGAQSMGELSEETSINTKTIRKDDAGEKGAIGSHGQNAPAQEKTPKEGADKGDKDE